MNVPDPSARRDDGRSAQGIGGRAVPDRSHLLTEQRNERSMKLHLLDSRACVDLMIREQGEVTRAMMEAAPALTAFVEATAKRFRADGSPGDPGRLVYVGAGTSGRLGVLDASEAPPTFHVEAGRIVGIIAGGDPALRRSSEGREDDSQGATGELSALGLCDDDTVLGIAAGGTTPYVLGALRAAKQLAPGCLTGLLTCAPVPRPADADHLIVLAVGPEILTGSTRLKAGTATKEALNIISTTLMIRAGRIHENLMIDLRATNDKLKDRAVRIISTVTGQGRAEALAALERADGSVRRAIEEWTGGSPS